MRSSRRNRNNLNKRGHLETLEARNLLAAQPVISEFLAANQSGLQDEDGDTSDWIEIYNSGDDAVDLFGYSLTDDADDLTKWRLPHVNVAPGERLVVFASNKDREDPTQNLHTNFRLSSNGEYLALVAPDGESIVTEFGPSYPQQVPDVAYGLSDQFESVTLMQSQTAARYFVPEDNSLQDSWFAAEFSDADWISATTPIGYDSGGEEPSSFSGKVEKLGPVGYWRMEEIGGTLALNSGSAGEDADGSYENEPDLTLAGPDATVNAALPSGNSATLFDGRNDAITTGLSLNNMSGFTIMGYVFPSVDAGRREALFGQRDTIRVGFPTVDELRLEVPDATLNYDFVQPRDNWYHIAAVGDGAQIKLYIDGTLVASADHVTDNYGESELKFGIGGGGITRSAGDTFEGGIDEVAVLDRPISEAELTQLLDPTFSETTSFTDVISTDVQATAKDNSSSVFMRMPFNVEDPSRLEDLLLDVQYDDGFVAYLNGSEILRVNAPGEEDVTLTFDATSVARRSDDAAIESRHINISNSRDALTAGENILAVQALNFTADNPDLLFSAEITSHVTRVDLTRIGYLTTPTPERNNPITSPGIGPAITNVEHTPNVPQPEDSIVVTAEITETLASFSNAELVYRVMFEPEVVVPLSDDGTGADEVANDGVFTATIPGNIAEPGQMIRWYARATDANGESGRAPTFEFRTTNNQSPEYFGTIVADDVTSQLPILHWFVEEPGRARGGTRASLFYNGEFYDNMFVRSRGGSTEGLAKTNFKFDFKGDTFRFDPDFDRVEEFNINSTFTDKSQVRQAMSFEAYSVMGAASSMSFPMHVRQNDEFFGIFNFIEEPDEEMLERNGLDRDGALYKHYNEFTSASGSRKKTREYEDNSDLNTFIRDVNGLDGEELANYLYDNVDIPAVLNYLVATVLVHQNDNPHKNHYLYRDSNDTGEWQFIPWDHDLTWGSNWVGTSTSDVIYADVDFITFGPVPSHPPELIQPSHPFVNTELHREWNNHWNRLMDALLRQPSIKEMYLRRLRTGMDLFLGAPGTTDSYFDQRFLEYQAALEQDDVLDREKWRRTFGDRDQSSTEAIQIIRDEYLAVRRVHLYETHGVDNLGNEIVLNTLVPEFTDASYFIPTNNDLGTTWTELGFDDASWETGQTGIGFDNRDNFTDLINTVVQNPGEVQDGATSIFTRIPFTATGVSELEELTLKMKYDDGFIAYINGTRVTSGSLRDEEASFDSRGRGRANPQQAQFQNFSIDLADFPNLLNEGENLLAIHGMNSSSTGGDMLILPELVDGPVSNILIAGIPHGQEGSPALTFDPVDYDAHPQSGNQDEEYIRINNPTEDAVDISGWQLTGGVEFTFDPGTVVTSGGSIFVSPDVKTFRARETGPSGNQGLFVQGNYSGHLSQFGDEVQLVAADGTLLDSLVIPAAPSDVQTNLRVTEIHYNPPGFDDATEFIELQNISAATTLDLSGVTISQGPLDPFVFAEGTSLTPGGHVLVVNNQTAFTAAYPSVAQDLIAGEFNGGLANGGERIKVDDALGNTVVDFRFADGDPWSIRADGDGATLTLDDPSTSRDLLGKWYSWRGSSKLGGTPGSSDAEINSVVISEVLSNTEADAADSIELWNPTSEPIDISGYYLSDSSNNLQKYQLPAGTVLAAGAYLVVDESQFNPTPQTPSDNHFALNGEGDAVWLTMVDENSETWFVDDVHFGATRAGESLGRFSHGPLVPTASTTFGSENSSPRNAPVMISEIHYHPAAPSAAALAADPQVDLGDLEFIEIQNTSNDTVDLSNWRIRGGADYDFDAGQTLPPSETLVVVSFNAARPDNASRLNAFRAEYGIGENVMIVGGYAGQLGDSFDRVRLESRQAADSDSFVFEDGTLYDDRSPWPTAADGEGSSLTRVAGGVLGYDPGSWVAVSPSPGSVDVPNADFDADGDIDNVDIDRLCQAINSGTNESAFDLNGNGTVDFLDHNFMIFTVLGTDYGDSNLDGIFNSTDLVSAFQIAEYEDGIEDNSGWADGDWNCDGDFNSRDFVLAFQFGGFSEAAIAGDGVSRDVAAAIVEEVIDDSPATDEADVVQPELPNQKMELPVQTLDMIFAENDSRLGDIKQELAEQELDSLDEIDKKNELV